MGILQDHVALVTGASRGIGASIARRLAADGAAVIVNYSISKTAAEAVVAEILALGGRSVALQADMADPAAVHQLFVNAHERFGRLDILVNNAGISEYLPLEEITPDHFDRLFAINTRGPLLAMQEASRWITSQNGRIINISSGAARACPPAAGVYSA